MCMIPKTFPSSNVVAFPIIEENSSQVLISTARCLQAPWGAGVGAAAVGQRVWLPTLV